jgi:hypothetical protein
MLDGKAYQAHFPNDPPYNRSVGLGAPRIPNSAALLAALTALEDEFRGILSRVHPHSPVPPRR